MVEAHGALWRLRAWISTSLGVHRSTVPLLVLSVLILLQFEMLLCMACADCCRHITKPKIYTWLPYFRISLIHRDIYKTVP